MCEVYDVRLTQHARASRFAAGTRAPWVVAGFALALTACGQKGPLYLPDRGGAVVTSPAAAPPAPSPQEQAPNNAPTQQPQSAPTQQPQSAPTQQPQSAPTQQPQSAPTQQPQSAPTQQPQAPTTAPPKKTDKDSDSQTPH